MRDTVNSARALERESGVKIRRHKIQTVNVAVSRTSFIIDDINMWRNLPVEFEIAPKFARFFVIKSYSEDDVHKSIK